MIRLEITADSAAQFHDSLWRLFESLNPTRTPDLVHPMNVQPNFDAPVAERKAGMVPEMGAPYSPGEVTGGDIYKNVAETIRRGPGRPRKNPKVEPVTIDGTATEVKAPPADIGTADPSPAIIVPDDEPVAETPPAETAPATPAPFLALDPLKDAYTLDEVRTLAMAYVRAMVVDAKGNTDRDAARGVLKGLLGAFGVEGVGGLDEPQRLAMVKLIHHLAPFGRTPPAAETFAGIVASFGG
jgi:hypothetical protein